MRARTTASSITIRGSARRAAKAFRAKYAWIFGRTSPSLNGRCSASAFCASASPFFISALAGSRARPLS